MNANLLAGSVLNYIYNNLITHLPVHAIRKGFLRLFNKRISRKSVVLMHCRFLNFWKLELMDRVVVNQYCVLDCRRYRISIGPDTDIGPYTKVWTLGHDPDSPTHALYGGDVFIGHHVWVASGVTVLPGVRIADGTVVGAGSTVHKSTVEKDIIAGSPAKFIRKRNNPLSYELQYTPILE